MVTVAIGSQAPSLVGVMVSPTSVLCRLRQCTRVARESEKESPPLGLGRTSIAGAHIRQVNCKFRQRPLASATL